MDDCKQKFEEAMSVFVGYFEGDGKMKPNVGQRVEKLFSNPKFQEKMQERKAQKSANKCDLDDIEKFGLFFTAMLKARLGKCEEMEKMLKELE